MNYKNEIVFFADVHYDENKLNIIEYSVKYVINYIKKNKPKFVIIGGDYFNKRINSDSKAYQTAINNLIEISQNCKYLIVYKGTHFHDADQLSVLNSIKKIQPNIFYFDKFTTIELENIKFAIIPEEYPKNYNEYYNKLYSNNFDIVCGHGMLEGAKIHNNIVNKFIKDLKFNHKQIEEKTNCKYNLWGHIHIPQQLSEKTFYVGSIARTQFGEEEEKRFLVIDINNWKIKSINVPTYEFLTFNYKNFQNNLEELEELLKDDKIFIRIFTKKIDLDLKLLKEKYKDKIKIILNNEEIEEINNINHTEIIDKPIIEQYKYFLNLELEKKKFTKHQKELLKIENINPKLENLIENINK